MELRIEDCKDRDRKVVIIGKNCNLDEYLPLKFNDEVVVCLNGAINLVDRCDWWVITEYSALSELNKKGKKNINKIMLPAYPRYEQYGYDGIHYSEFLKELNKDVDYVLYNGFWPPKLDKDIFCTGVTITVADTALKLMIELGYRDFEFYGIGVDWRYTSSFKSWKPTDTIYLKMAYDSLMRLLKANSCSYKFNFSKNTLENIYGKYSIKEDTGQGDKGTVHSYIPIYSNLFERYRCMSTIMEIGINRGHSIKMWGDYFIDSTIVGVDISDGFDMSQFNDQKYKIVIGDATDHSILDKIGDMKFDIIIDDGDHTYNSQRRSFDILKSRMNNGGLYIIEDVNGIREEYKAWHTNCEIIDLRKNKGRFDDVLIIYRF